MWLRITVEHYKTRREHNVYDTIRTSDIRNIASQKWKLFEFFHGQIK